MRSSHVRLRYPGHLLHGVAVLALAALLGTALLRHLSYPLIWHDEGDTVMFGQRVLEHGVPKVHGERNVVYGLRQDRSIGVDPELDAYLGSPWGQYYWGALGVALAARVDDPNAKTARLRLPFALAGAAGLALLLAALLPAVEPGTPRLRLAAGFLLLALASTSLLLHLREARYYPLAVLLSAGVVWTHARRHLWGGLGRLAHGALLVGLLFALCNTFYPLLGVFVVTLALEAAWRAATSTAPDRARQLLLDVLPLALALAAAAPVIAFLNLFEVTAAFMELYEARPENTYASILATVVRHLLRFELLAPALLSRAAVVLLARGQPTSPGLARRRALARMLGLFCLVHVVLVARTPFFYERYYITIGPMLIAIVLLDAASLAELARARSAVAARARAAIAALALAVAGALGVRGPEIAGQLRELREPYQGPLDVIVPWIAQRYADPSELVIATDYEETSLMYYLGSHVIVGYYGANLEADLEHEPDLIVPRYWPAQRAAIEALIARGNEPGRGGWEVHRFPVAGLPANNVPSLSPDNQASGFTHRFETVRALRPEQQATVLERRRSPRAPDR